MNKAIGGVIADLAALELEAKNVDESGLFAGISPEQSQKYLPVVVVTRTGLH